MTLHNVYLEHAVTSSPLTASHTSRRRVVITNYNYVFYKG